MNLLQGLFIDLAFDGLTVSYTLNQPGALKRLEMMRYGRSADVQFITSLGEPLSHSRTASLAALPLLEEQEQLDALLAREGLEFLGKGGEFHSSMIIEHSQLSMQS